MPALNFQSRFAPLVESGEKRQTIRKFRKDGRDPKPGCKLHLFTGMRTKECRRLRVHRSEASLRRMAALDGVFDYAVECKSVTPVKINGWPTIIDGPDDGEVCGFRPWQPRFNIGDDWLISNRRSNALAKRDGFENVDEMVAWFEKVHGLPFAGLLIRW